MNNILSLMVVGILMVIWMGTAWMIQIILRNLGAGGYGLSKCLPWYE
ncbi:MAG: hypothetical protein KAR64_06195 [Thermoplasmatales archaeon]|nr:hypothetical protein [Thermoplasmatales archaeon]